MIDCIFCNQPFANKAALMEHSATCEKHPAVNRSTEAASWITNLELALADEQEENSKLRAALAAAQAERDGWKQNCEIYKQKYGDPNSMPESVARLMIAGDTVPSALARIAEENAALRAELAETP